MKYTKKPFLSFLLKGSILSTTLLLITAFFYGNDIAFKKFKGPVKTYKLMDTQVTWSSKTPILKLMREESGQFSLDGNFIGTRPYYNINKAKIYNKKDSRKVNIIIDSISRVYQKNKSNDSFQRKGIEFNFYDKRNNKTETRKVNEYGWINIFEYNLSGEIKKITLCSPIDQIPKESIVNKTTWLKNGNIKDYKFVNKKLTEIRLHKMTYDIFGNWTIDSTFTNDTLSYLRIRNFEYWPTK